jgi:hypothetical protein
MGSPYVRKGLEGHKNTGFVLKFVKFEQDSKGYVVCEDDLRGGVQEDDSLTMVTRTEDANEGSEMLDIQPLAILAEQLGDNSVST